jgi:hypothetical protein
MVPSSSRISYRKISAELAAHGHKTATGKPFVRFIYFISCLEL